MKISPTFKVYASDTNGHSTEAIVYISITSEARNRPYFMNSIISGNIFENNPPGTFITRIQANGTSAIKYKLLGSQYLYVSPNGDLLTKWPIDRERYEYITATVVAENIYNSSLYDTAVVNITVLDKIDTLPILLHDVYHIYHPTSNSISVQAITQDNTSDIVYDLINGTDGFTINHTSGNILSITPPTIGVYHLQIQVSISGLLYSTTNIIINVDNTPELHPSVIYISTFNYRLLLQQYVTTLSSVANILHIETSPCNAQKHFQLIGNDLYIANNAINTGKYQLNISLIDSTVNKWYTTVTVYVKLVTDHTLQNTVSIVFPNLQKEHLLEHFLSPFIESVKYLFSCKHDCVDIIGIQATPIGSMVAFAVRNSDLVTYVSTNQIRNTLHYESYLQQQLKWTVYLSKDPCTESSCINLQHCRSSLTLDISRFDTLSKGSHSITSHDFTSIHTCYCPSGYNPSNNCSSEINECDNNVCHFNGECIDLIDDYKCICPTFTSGKDCSIVCSSQSCDLCTPNPCLNGGTCTVQSGTKVCGSCPEGYTGTLCQLTTIHINSYITLPSINSATSVSIQFMFATINSNALLFYTGKYNMYI